MSDVSPRSSSRVRSASTLVLTLVLWASAFAGIREGLQSYSPGALLLLRFSVAAVALIIYAVIIKLRLPDWRDIPAFLVLGFMGITVYQAGLTFGEQSVSAGTASFLVASVPCFTALFAFILLRERLKRWNWLGILISFLGVALISFSAGGGFSFTPGTLLVLIASLAESIYFIFQKRFLRKYSSFELTAYTMWAGTLFMFVFAPQLIQEFPRASLSATRAVVYMGIFPAAIANVTWAITLSRMPASIATSFLNFSPILSTLIAWIWLHEIPTPLTFVGGLVIIIGVLLVNSRSTPHFFGRKRYADLASVAAVEELSIVGEEGVGVWQAEPEG
ncbi:DMT family transporter [Dictyobacter arantiisoli]|uniref:Membrane protein n=1 Tax=Dictyobacter arantiisoli TaxID=2014874 RepID=A0A5A5THB3_9CHLR|nr:DMT family transporter [Dictyobacter arantiisoli]GCF10702.1 membrane protein [Dictyobacter arantiisoli]